VGLNIAEALLHSGCEVTAYVRPGARMAFLRKLPVRVVEGRLLDIATLRRALRNADAVIHTAGNTSTEWKHLAAAEEVNVHGTRAVLEAVQAERVRRLIYTSTTATLESSPDPTAQSEPRPVTGFRRHSAYATTKADGEAMLLPHSSCIVLSPAEVIGPYDHTMQWGRMVVAVAMAQVPFVPPGGASFCPARDVAEAHVAALTRGEPGKRYVLAGHNVKLSYLLGCIEKITGGSAEPISKLPYRLQTLLARLRERASFIGCRPPVVDSFRMRVLGGDHYFDDTPARRDLGYTPRPLETAIEECYRWYREQGFLPSTPICERPKHD
jgi:dihydroflavonol-4-reductase